MGRIFNTKTNDLKVSLGESMLWGLRCEANSGWGHCGASGFLIDSSNLALILEQIRFPYLYVDGICLERNIHHTRSWFS